MSRAALLAAVSIATSLAGFSATTQSAGATSLRFLKKVKVGGWPKAIAVSNDGKEAFVAVALDRQVAVLSRESMTITRRIDVGGRPEGVALSPDGKRLYVSLGDQALVEARDAGAGTLLASIPVAPRPRGLAVSSDGRTLYVVCARSGALQLVDTKVMRVRAEVDVGWSPRSVAVVPRSNLLLVVHAVGHSVYVIDAKEAKVLERLKGFGRRPLDVAIAKSGAFAMVPSSKKDRVFRIDLASRRIDAAFFPGKGPVAVALTPSGKTLFTALWDEGRVTYQPSDKPRRRRPPGIKTGKGPIALVLAPSGKTLYVACMESHDVWIYAVK